MSREIMGMREEEVLRRLGELYREGFEAEVRRVMMRELCGEEEARRLVDIHGWAVSREEVRLAVELGKI